MSEDAANPDSPEEKTGSASGKKPSPSGSTASSEDEQILRQRSRGAGGTPKWLIPAALIVCVLVVGSAAGYTYYKGFSKTTSTGCSQSVILQGAGSTFVAPLMDAWISNFTAATVNYQSVGSGTGIQDLQAGAAQYAASDAPLSSIQKNAFEHPVLTLPEAAGAVVVIYNIPGLSAPINVNGTFLALVFMGSISNWNSTMLQQLNPGVALPSQPIVTVHRSDGSGTSYVFQDYLSQENKFWAANYGFATTWLGPGIDDDVASSGSAGVSNTVLTTPYSISYVDLTYAFTNHVPFAAVENPSGTFVLPSVTDTASAIADRLAEPGFSLPLGSGNWSSVNMLNAPGAGDYPLATFTYLMFYQAPDQAWLDHVPISVYQILSTFVDYVLHQGQNSSAGLYYVPLPSEVVSADMATLPLQTYSGSSVGYC